MTPFETKLKLYEQKREAQLYALAIVRDPEYRRNLLAAARARSLPPAVECMLMAYAWGKPADRVELGRPGAFGDLHETPATELVSRLRALAAALDAEAALEPLDAQALRKQATDRAAAACQAARTESMPLVLVPAPPDAEALDAAAAATDEYVSRRVARYEIHNRHPPPEQEPAAEPEPEQEQEDV
jgi:hypothetical protein